MEMALLFTPTPLTTLSGWEWSVNLANEPAPPRRRRLQMGRRRYCLLACQ